MMVEYPVIDAHIHTHQNREMGLQAKQGNDHTDYVGTIEELVPFMEKAGIYKAVMVNIIPLADMRNLAIGRLPDGLSEKERRAALQEIDERMLGRLERRNSWTCGVAKDNPNLIPFITIDPLMDEQDMVAEILDKANNQGARGIKLHPSIQVVFPNDRHLWPIYQTAQQLDLPIISHAGTYENSPDYARPGHFEEVLQSFPNLTLVLAHLGKGYFDEVTSLASKYPNLQFDCSGVIEHSVADGGLADDDFTALIREIGVERVMFGSDYPWFDPTVGMARLLRLNLSEQERRLIFADNAIRIYKLS